MSKTKRDSERPAKSKPDEVPTFREQMRRLIGKRWTEVWASVPAAIAGEDIEGVHDVRVASRRLRAAMDVAVDCFPRAWYRPLHKSAKQITQALGEVRDRDVLITALNAERATVPAAERPGLDSLITQIETERTAARAEMERFLTDLLAGPVPSTTTRRFAAEGPPATAKLEEPA